MHFRTLILSVSTAGALPALLVCCFGAVAAGCGTLTADDFVGPGSSDAGDSAAVEAPDDVELINAFDVQGQAPTQAVLPVREADYACPEGARYATDGAGRAFCLFEGLTLPPDVEVTAVCQHLNRNYIGFGWPAGAADDGYQCPAGATYAVDEDSRELCLFDELPLPLADGLRPECFGLADGALGFSWETALERGRQINDLQGQSDVK